METTSNLNLFVVDDDEVDVRAVKRALRHLEPAPNLVVARDGIEALERLQDAVDGDPGAGPPLVLLDINMPRMDGFEFLERLRAHDELHSAIVFVLTTSNDSGDVRRAYGHHVAGYIVKSSLAARAQDLADLVRFYRDCVSFS